MSTQKVILLTGGSSGIGLYCAEGLAASSPPPLIVIASRSPPPAKLLSSKSVVYLPLDLADATAVRTFVSTWSHGPIDSLVLNAGIFPSSAPSYTPAPSSTELSLAINHSHQALLLLLLKSSQLLSSTCKIIFVTSAMHDPKAPLAPACPFWESAEKVAESKEKELMNPMVRYANSKLANLLFAYALERRVKVGKKGIGKGWNIIAFEPGFCPGKGSNLGRDGPAAARWITDHIIPHLLWIFRAFGTVTSSPPHSGKLLAELALPNNENDKSLHGKYVLLDRVKPSSVDSYDEGKQEDLWKWTVGKVAEGVEERGRFEEF